MSPITLYPFPTLHPRPSPTIYSHLISSHRHPYHRPIIKRVPLQPTQGPTRRHRLPIHHKGLPPHPLPPHVDDVEDGPVGAEESVQAATHICTYVWVRVSVCECAYVRMGAYVRVSVCMCE